jgi:hypothetical protein
VGRRDVNAYFREYVFGFMESDIQRELTFAQSPLGAGNVLAALGLVVYTEDRSAEGAVHRGRGLERELARDVRVAQRRAHLGVAERGHDHARHAGRERDSRPGPASWSSSSGASCAG